MINPPYGERIEVGGKAARASAQDRDTPGDFFPAPGRALEARLHPAPGRLDRLQPDMKLPGRCA